MRGRIIGVAVLAILAGCGGISTGDAGGATPTLTPAPVPTDGPVAIEGVMSDRVDAATLVENHRAALNETSYTAIETLRMGRPDNVTYERRTVMAVAAGGEPFRVDEEITGPVRRVSSLATDVWWDGEDAYYRQPWGGSDSVYYERRSHPSDTLQIRGRLADVLDALSVTSVERGPGDATIVAGSIEDTTVVPRRDGLTTAENATMTMRIESNGVISRLAIGYDATDYYDGQQRVRYTYRVTDVGSTEVTQPDWVAYVDGEGRDGSGREERDDGTATPSR